mmetsp:Transcript_25490/g.73502  ORF Transcript_25490/g.73502 Transcript_25490/m.73502 type:complete len:248 (-) Transcript_25490:405-1148(-)
MIRKPLTLEARSSERIVSRFALFWTQSGTCAPAQKVAMLKSHATFGLVMSLMMVSTAENAVPKSESSFISSSIRTRSCGGRRQEERTRGLGGERCGSRSVGVRRAGQRTSVSLIVLPVTTTSGRGTHPAIVPSDSRCILTPSPSTISRPTVASRFQRVGGFDVSSSLELATTHRDASAGSKVPSVSSSSLKFPRTSLSCSFIVSIRNSAALSPGKKICSIKSFSILIPPPTVAAPPAASSRFLICAA